MLGYECRICLDSADDDNTNRLIAPCMCKGTNAFIHERCLSQLRAMSTEKFFVCPTCLFAYQFEDYYDPTEEITMFIFACVIICVAVLFWKSAKFRNFVNKHIQNDLLLFFGAIVLLFMAINKTVTFIVNPLQQWKIITQD